MKIDNSNTNIDPATTHTHLNTASSTEESSPRAEKTKPQFLELPGEIRNIIYSYALTSEDGLVYVRGSDDIGRLYDHTLDRSASASPQRESNQLQFVCRQLRNETRALGLQYNELHMTMYADAISFIHSFPAAVCKHLKIIDVGEGEVGPPKRGQGLQALKEFCATHPHIQLRARLPALNFKGPDEPLFDLYITHMQYCFRGKTDIPDRIRTIPGAANRLYEDLRSLNAQIGGPAAVNGAATASSLPDNLRLCPQDNFDETALRARIAENDHWTDLIKHGVEGGIDAYVKIIKDVLEEGI